MRAEPQWHGERTCPPGGKSTLTTTAYPPGPRETHHDASPGPSAARPHEKEAHATRIGVFWRDVKISRTRHEQNV